MDKNRNNQYHQLANAIKSLVKKKEISFRIKIYVA